MHLKMHVIIHHRFNEQMKPMMTASPTSIADEILSQLGGNKFTVMTGARDFVDIDRGLQFRLPSNLAANKINFITVKLEADDLYTVQFSSKQGFTFADKARYEGIYAQELQELFTAETGLDTHL